MTSSTQLSRSDEAYNSSDRLSLTYFSFHRFISLSELRVRFSLNETVLELPNLIKTLFIAIDFCAESIRVSTCSFVIIAKYPIVKSDYSSVTEYTLEDESVTAVKYTSFLALEGPLNTASR